jgi:hypothetical protein
MEKIEINNEKLKNLENSIQQKKTNNREELKQKMHQMLLMKKTKRLNRYGQEQKLNNMKEKIKKTMNTSNENNEIENQNK